MPRLTEDDPEYIEHVRNCSLRFAAEAVQRNRLPTTSVLERWHGEAVRPVLDEPRCAGHIRQRSQRLPYMNKEVRVGRHRGAPAIVVPQKMHVYDSTLKDRVARIDKDWSVLPDDEQLLRVTDLVAWTHGEIIRIHPFVNGNGRLARFAANILLARYGITYQIAVKPRPGGEYANSADASMMGTDIKMQIYLANEIVQST